jgi:type 1 fimbria pilin
MRIVKAAVLVTAIVLFGSSGVAAAAPKDYCADLKGGNTGSTCEIQLADPGYNVNISIPTDYPDQQSLADYVSSTRDAFLNVAKSSAPRTAPYELTITSADYSSAIPPRGTQAVVLRVVQNVGTGQPQTTYKAFNWDQSYRKSIVYAAAPDDKKTTPLWRVPDPLKTVFPIVQAELQKQGVVVSPTAGYDPLSYQEFAVTNDGVIFFFSQGVLLPPGAAATQVLVPRSAIDPMLA